MPLAVRPDSLLRFSESDWMGRPLTFPGPADAALVTVTAASEGSWGPCSCLTSTSHNSRCYLPTIAGLLCDSVCAEDGSLSLVSESLILSLS